MATTIRKGREARRPHDPPGVPVHHHGVAQVDDPPKVVALLPGAVLEGEAARVVAAAADDWAAGNEAADAARDSDGKAGYLGAVGGGGVGVGGEVDDFAGVLGLVAVAAQDHDEVRAWRETRLDKPTCKLGYKIVNLIHLLRGAANVDEESFPFLTIMYLTWVLLISFDPK